MRAESGHRCAGRALALGAPLLLIGLSSCRITEVFDEPQSQVLADAEPVPVTLAETLFKLREKTKTNQVKTTYKVGYLLRKLFPAVDGRSFLSRVDSNLELSQVEDGWRTQYSLTVALQKEGTYHLITASGAGASTEAPNVAGRRAIEACVEDLYGQIAAVVEG